VEKVRLTEQEIRFSYTEVCYCFFFSKTEPLETKNLEPEDEDTTNLGKVGNPLSQVDGVRSQNN
jgi:hypothetical protein